MSYITAMSIGLVLANIGTSCHPNKRAPQPHASHTHTQLPTELPITRKMIQDVEAFLASGPLEQVQKEAPCRFLIRLLQSLQKGRGHINAKDPKSNNLTALHIAIIVGDLTIVEALLSRKANVNAQDPASKKMTPLMLAVLYCNIPIVQALCNTPGINLYAKAENGATAIQMAEDQFDKATTSQKRHYYKTIIRTLENCGAIA